MRIRVDVRIRHAGIRQHTSAYVSIRQHTYDALAWRIRHAGILIGRINAVKVLQRTPAPQHTSAHAAHTLRIRSVP